MHNEPWQMTRKEFRSIGDAEKFADRYHKRYIDKPGFSLHEAIERMQQGMRDLYIDKLETVTKKGKGELWEFYNWIGISDEKHQQLIQRALFEGKPVSAKVLKDYPELKRKIKTRKTKPLPKDAENVQTILFDSKEYLCYGKPIGMKSYGVYCRKKQVARG